MRSPHSDAPRTSVKTGRRARLLAVIGSCVIAMPGYAAVRLHARSPSHDRAWVSEAARLPLAKFDGEQVTIRNVRDFRHHADGTVDEAWATRSYDIAALESVWFGIAPFSRDWRGPAHAFLSFGFSDGRYVAVSIEARKEVGETYSMRRGLLREFELMYVIGDERDVIGLRALRGDLIELYPIRTSHDRITALFRAMIGRANDIADTPEFYGTLRNNCTTNIVAHVNTLADEPISWSLRVLLPGYADEIAFERGLIDAPTLDVARARHRIDERARQALESEDFSRLIRQPKVGADGVEPPTSSL